MTKRSFSEIAKTQCGTCVAIAAVHGDLPRMAQLLSRGPTSMYIYWSWAKLTEYNDLTPQEEIYKQMKELNPSTQTCDHVIIDNLNDDELNEYRVFQTHCVFRSDPLFKFLLEFCSKETVIQFIREVQGSYLDLCPFMDPLDKAFCVKYGHGGGTSKGFCDCRMRIEAMQLIVQSLKPDFLTNILSRWPDLLNRTLQIDTHYNSCRFGGYYTCSEYILKKMPFPAPTGSALYQMLDVLLDAGLNLNTDGARGGSILTAYTYTPPAYTMQLVHFFITRGLTNFLVAPHPYDVNAVCVPFPIMMLLKIKRERSDDNVIGALQNIELFHSLSTIRTISKVAFAVQQLECVPNSLSGILFAMYKNRMRSPLTLQDSARMSIRDSIAPIQFRKKLSQLPISPPLKKYVAYESLPDVKSAYDLAYIQSPH